MIKRGKKGQFFLIAALIIVTILLSFMTTKSGIKVSKEKYKIYDLGEELNLETADTIDHGIYTSPAERGEILESWATKFSNYQGFAGQEEFIFIYTDAGSFKGLRFSRGNRGDVSLDLAGTTAGVANTDVEIESINLGAISDIAAEGINRIRIEDFMVTIDPSKEDFYFVIRGESGEVAQR